MSANDKEGDKEDLPCGNVGSQLHEESNHEGSEEDKAGEGARFGYKFCEIVQLQLQGCAPSLRVTAEC